MLVWRHVRVVGRGRALGPTPAAVRRPAWSRGPLDVSHRGWERAMLAAVRAGTSLAAGQGSPVRIAAGPNVARSVLRPVGPPGGPDASKYEGGWLNGRHRQRKVFVFNE